VDAIKSYQLSAIDWLRERTEGYLAIDMGLGKTRIILERFQHDRVMVVAPLRVATITWPNEIAKWVPGIEYTVLHGMKKMAQYQTNSPWLITNYESLSWLYKQNPEHLKGRILILDEATRVKSFRAGCTKQLIRMRELFSQCFLLSGTPTPQGPQDLWSQFRILDGGGTFGTSWTRFFETYWNQNYYSYVVTPKRGTIVEEITTKAAPKMFRLAASDHLDLPPLIEQNHEVSFDDVLMKRYTKFHQEFIDTFTDTTACSAATLSCKLRQFVQGALYKEEGGSFTAVHTLKSQALHHLLEQETGPKIVVINFKFELHTITLGHGMLPALVGGMSNSLTRQTIDKWNEGKIPILLVHPAAVAHGLNLQAGGHHIIWYALPWSLEHYQQMNGRLVRQGQEHHVLCTRIVVKNTIDQRIAKVLSLKDSNQTKLLEALRNG